MDQISLEQKQKALDKIAREIESCKICQQHKIGKAVPGEGNPDADIVFIGEAPGKKEAETGRPFVGPAGKILRGLIAEVGLKDDQVYITSPVKYLPKYVTPKPEDIAHGRIHLSNQLRIIEPKLVVLLGATAVKAVLGDNLIESEIKQPFSSLLLKRREGTATFQISKIHGTVIEQNGTKYFISYHPAAPLHNPSLRQELKRDFVKLKKLINGKRR